MSSSKSTTITVRRYLQVTKTSPAPIRPEDVRVEVQPRLPGARPSAEPNFLALSILWAHFEACRRGLLTENLPSPWEQIHEPPSDPADPGDVERARWVQFLRNMITGPDWTTWIQDRNEVRRRALEAYSRIGGQGATESEAKNGL